MTLLTVKPAIDPRKTVRREFLTAIIAVIKNVLSPISDAVIINADVRNEEKKLVFVVLGSILLILYDKTIIKTTKLHYYFLRINKAGKQ